MSPILARFQTYPFLEIVSLLKSFPENKFGREPDIYLKQISTRIIEVKGEWMIPTQKNPNTQSAMETLNELSQLDHILEADPIEGAIQVLLIEDSPFDARFFQTKLASAETKETYQVTHVKRMTTAMKVLGRRSFDAVVLDLTLPDSPNVNTVEKIKALYPKLPVLVITSNDDYEVAVKSFRQGADDYIVKQRLNSEAIVGALRLLLTSDPSESLS